MHINDIDISLRHGSFLIRLSVIRGPDQGKDAVFRDLRITIGRGTRNKFGLRDGLVSQQHGEILLSGNKAIYRDLRSRHGSLVRLNTVSINLHDRSQIQEIELAEISQIEIGETSIRVMIEDLQQEKSFSPRETQNDTVFEERVVKRSTVNVDDVTRRLVSQDPRLVNIFKLSKNLNTAIGLNEILDQICAATFDAFPSAKVFAITTVPQDEKQKVNTILLRERNERKSREVEPILSRSLLHQVVTTRESVLFVRDASGIQPTESIINASITACMAAPLVGQRELLGVMQVDTRGQGGLFGPDDLDLFTVLSSYTAFAMERVQLTQAIKEQFEGIVRLSVAAIDARDPSTSGHSERVAKYTQLLAEKVAEQSSGPFAQINFSREEIVELRYAALLHDFGKIGVRESVLMKPARLHPDDLRNILTRFEAARAAASRDAYLSAVKTGIEKDLSLESVQSRAIAIEDVRIRMLNMAENTILQWQPGRPLTSKAQKELIRIGKLTYSRSDGKRELLLQPSELENMLIPRGTLNAQEWEDMHSHVSKSREFLCQIPWTKEFAKIPDIAGWHHEKLDGSGYPDGISGDKISYQVRILTIADIFDAMTAADRPYRSAATFERAMNVLIHEAKQGLLDRNLVTLFCKEIVPHLNQKKK